MTLSAEHNDTDCVPFEDKMDEEKALHTSDIQLQEVGAVAGVPVPMVPQQARPATTVVVVTPDRDDFIPACLGTACFGLVGLGFFACLCNTPTGRVGASTGCMVYGAYIFAIYLALLILYTTHDCDDRHARTTDDTCRLTLFEHVGRLIAYVVIAGIIFIVSLALRIKFKRELKNPRPDYHIQVHEA